MNTETGLLWHPHAQAHHEDCGSKLPSV